MQNIFLETLRLFSSIFILFLCGGYILYIPYRLLGRLYRETFGWYGILWTAWIGTPIHECSHAIMAKIFGHQIVSFSLFRPNENTGNLGSVEHTYNTKSIYQRTGLFFIGIAPILGGIFSIAILILLFIPQGKYILSGIYIPTAEGYSVVQTIQHYIGSILSLISAAQTHVGALTIYLIFCIASHMVPSKKDLQNTLRGFPFFFILATGILFSLLLMGTPKERIQTAILPILEASVALELVVAGMLCVHIILIYPIALLRRLIR